MVIAIPFVYAFGVTPWYNFGGFDTKIEKTALETTAELDDKMLQFKGADMYLSVAVSDAEQPQPNKVRFYVGEHGNSDKNILDKNTDDDGFKADTLNNYYQVYYSTQQKPSTINNKVSVGKKVITATGYNPDSPITLMLKPKTDSSSTGDSPDMAWYVNCDESKLVGDIKRKCTKHAWLQYKNKE